MVERPNTLAGLIEKRRELAGKIEYHQNELRQAAADLDHLDATIRMFDPDADLEAIWPRPHPPRSQAFRGEATRVLLAALRHADGPLTTAQLAERLMAERGQDVNDRRLRKTMIKRVGSSLRDHRRKGLVRSEVGSSRLLLWSLNN